MDPLPIRKATPPELILRTKLVELMERRQWFVHITHGSAYSSGLPDLFCAHVNYGVRWIECKNAAGYHFTVAQRDVFPKMTAKNVGIWIVALFPGFSDEMLDYEYRNVLIEGPPNWTKFLNHSTRPY